MPALELRLKNRLLEKFQLRLGDSLTIGRREDNTIVLEDPAVSGHHAKVEALGGRFVLIDLQSKNGSFVNEQLINSHWLKDGDIITIGDHTLIFEQNQKKTRRKQKQKRYDDTLALNSSQHRRMMKKSTSHKSINVVRFWDKSQNRRTENDIDPQAATPHTGTRKSRLDARLTYMAGGSGRVELTRKITTIGKHPTSDIVVRGLLLDPTSATIVKETDGYYLNYIGGLPKPKINDIPVSESSPLKDADIIEIGSVRLKFSITGQIS